MNPIREKQKALERVLDGSVSIILSAIQGEEVWIREAIKAQLRDGIRSDGTDMPEYVENSKAPSAPGKITLFDTGEFHSSIDPLFDQVGIEFNSEDEKAKFLVAKYGREILGLTRENIARLQARVLPKIILKIRSIL